MTEYTCYRHQLRRAVSAQFSGKTLNGGVKNTAGGFHTKEIPHLGLLILESLVSQEEILDFLQVVRGQILQVIHVLIAGITDIDCQNLDIRLTAVNHIHTADDAAVHIAAREGGGRGEYQNIQRVSVQIPGVLDKPVFCGVVYGGVQHTVKLDAPRAFINLVLIATSHRDFDSGFNHSHDIVILSE